MFPKGHKLDCTCGICKAIRGERGGENHPSWVSLETKICECGCKETFECKITSKQRFIRGHNNRGENNTRKGVYVDLTGQKFGRLTVIRDLNKRDKHGHILWEVVCTCGRIKEISSGNLHAVQSCGCYRRELAINDNPAKRLEVRKILREQKIGDKNPAWQGGISKDLYHENFNDSFRRRIKNRDENICQICGKTQEKNIIETSQVLDVHHIYYDPMNNCSNNGDFITLCKSCHSKTNFNRDYWENYFNSINLLMV